MADIFLLHPSEKRKQVEQYFIGFGLGGNEIERQEPDHEPAQVRLVEMFRSCGDFAVVRFPGIRHPRFDQAVMKQGEAFA